MDVISPETTGFQRSAKQVFDECYLAFCELKSESRELTLLNFVARAVSGTAHWTVRD